MVARRKRNGNASVHALESRLDALMSDLQSLQKDVRGLAQASGEYATSQANGVLRNAQAQADETLEQIEEWTSENIGSLRDSVRDQPLASCILSMSAGALIGALLLRR